MITIFLLFNLHSLLGVDQLLLLGAAQLHRGSALLVALLGDLVPDARVDPQRTGQGEADPGAGDPAAQRAAHAAYDAVRLGHSLQAARAEGVLAVEHSRDPVPAGVLVVAHRALQVLVVEHSGMFIPLFSIFKQFPSTSFQPVAAAKTGGGKKLFIKTEWQRRDVTKL